MAAEKFICTTSTMQFELFLCLAKHIKSDLTILFVAFILSLQLHIFTKGHMYEDFWYSIKKKNNYYTFLYATASHHLMKKTALIKGTSNENLSAYQSPDNVSC